MSIPAAPACCLLAARAWMSISVLRPGIASARDNVFSRWSVALLGIVLVAVAVAAGVSLFELGLELPPAAVLMPISLAAAGVVLAAAIVRRRAVSPAVFGTLIAILLLIYSCVLVMGLPILERARPTAVLAQGLRPELPSDAQVGLYSSRSGVSACGITSSGRSAVLGNPSDVKKFLDAKGRLPPHAR